MRIVVTEPFMFDYVPQLAEATRNTHDWEILRTVDAASLADAEVVVGGGLTAELAASAKRLRLVQTPAAGYEDIALDALQPGVIVANTFHHGRSIAEHVVMVTLALTRHLLDADRALRAGRWLSPRFDRAVEIPSTLRGRTVGVVGLGEIGSEVIRLCTAFDMRRVAIRRDVGKPAPAGADLAWLGGVEQVGQLCAESDVVVVTVPYSAETAGLVGRRELAAMRPEALLVNVARGPVVDEDALYAALAEHRIGGAALDVWWSYPGPSGEGQPSRLPFADLDNVVLTPHVSGVTTETFSRRVAEVAANINRLVDGDPLANVVHGPRGGGRTLTE